MRDAKSKVIMAFKGVVYVVDTRRESLADYLQTGGRIISDETSEHNTKGGEDNK